MKKYLKLFLVIVLLFLNANVFSQNSYKFGHINAQILISAMPETDSAQLKLENYIKQLDNQSELMQVELNNKLQEYENNKDSYTDFIRQTKEDELNDLNQRIQQFRANAQQEIAQKQADFFQPIVQKARSAIREVAKENGLIYIFDVSENVGALVLYYSEESQDIMPLVKRKLGIE